MQIGLPAKDVCFSILSGDLNGNWSLQRRLDDWRNKHPDAIIIGVDYSGLDDDTRDASALIAYTNTAAESG